MAKNTGGIDGSVPGLPWKLIGLIVLATVGLLFVLQNRARSPVQFLFFEINSRQWVNIAVAIALGVALDRLFLGWWRRRGARRD